MAGDAKKRQKKLEKKTAKRKEKRHELVRARTAGLPQRISAAVRFPVLHSWISSGQDGMGTAHISRELPTGEVAVASFLVDSYCLGVKDALAAIVHRTEYEAKFVQRAKENLTVRLVSPAEVRKFVEAAVAYAGSIGFPPHPDYATAALLFGDIKAADSDAVLEFGKDGKPLFIAGPYDTPERVREVVAILTDTCGQGNFDFVVPLAGPEFAGLLPE
jgi:hypothetical protein